MRNCFIKTTAFLSAILFLGSCANMGQGPTGGYVDSIPPSMVKSNPKANAVNVRDNKIEIYFDEYISLDNAQKEISVSPTQENQFIAKGIGKKVCIELLDSLLPNTTYTIDFGNSVKDFREGNPYESFHLSFSTGNEVDSMEISGYAIDAYSLLPQKGILVGVYSNTADSSFTTKRMERVTFTREDGSFTLRNLKPQKYLLVALEDLNGNKYFDTPDEAIASSPQLITPTSEVVELKDTTDSTAQTRTMVRHLPDSIILLTYKEDVKQQFFEKAERTQKDFISFIFKNAEKTTPLIKPININKEVWGYKEPSTSKDTFSYWLADTTLASMDTVSFQISFQKYDSAKVLVNSIDTINVVAKHERRRRKKDKRITYLTASEFSSPVEIGKVFKLSWDKPVVDFTSDKVIVQTLTDTTWTDIKATVRPSDKTVQYARTFFIDFNMEPEKKYKILIDSATVHDIYGNFNDHTTISTRIRGKDEYSNVIINVKNAPANAYVELCSGQTAKYKVKVDDKGIANIENVNPSEYTVRLFVDKNGDGEWTTGCYKKAQQPEEMYYFNKSIKLKANWDMEEDWDIKSSSLIEQSDLQNIRLGKKKK